MDSLGLLEALVRPDNLVEYQLDREVKFLADYRAQLEAVEESINAHVSPVADGPGDAVALSVQPTERQEVFQLFASPDAGFNKLGAVFAALCEEVCFLRTTAEAKFYAQLALFGHSKHDDADDYSEGILEAMMGRALPLFQDTANFAARLSAVALQLVLQLQALHAPRAGFAAGFRDVRLRPVLLALGDALAVLQTLDAIVTGNRVVAAAWDKFKRVADILRTDPAKYGADPQRAAAFDGLLTDLDATVIPGCMLRRCLDQQFEEAPAALPQGYRDQLRDASLELVQELLARVGTDAETGEAVQLVGQFGVYALWRSLPAVAGRAPPADLKRHFEQLWRTQERLPVVQLYSRHCWTAETFLLRYCSVPGLAPGAKSLVPRDPAAARAAYADALEAALAPAVNTLHARVAAWLVRAGMAFADAPIAHTRQPPMDLLRARAVLLNQALALAASGRRTLGTFLCLQLALGRDFKRRAMEPLTRVCELLKVLEGAARTHSAALAEAAPHVHRDNATAIMEVMLPLRLRWASANKNKVMADDVLRFLSAAVEHVQALVVGSEGWSQMRRIALELGLCVVMQKGAGVKEADCALLAAAAQQLALVAEFQPLMRRACDCSVLYWVREVMPAMVGVVCTVDGSAGAPDADSRHGARLQYLFAAFSDAARMLSLAVHLPPPPHASRRIVSAELTVGVGAAGGGAGGGGGGALGSSNSTLAPCGLAFSTVRFAYWDWCAVHTNATSSGAVDVQLATFGEMWTAMTLSTVASLAAIYLVAGCAAAGLASGSPAARGKPVAVRGVAGAGHSYTGGRGGRRRGAASSGRAGSGAAEAAAGDGNDGAVEGGEGAGSAGGDGGRDETGGAGSAGSGAGSGAGSEGAGEGASGGLILWLLLPGLSALVGSCHGLLVGAVGAALVSLLYLSIPYAISLNVAIAMGVSVAALLGFGALGRHSRKTGVGDEPLHASELE